MPRAGRSRNSPAGEPFTPSVSRRLLVILLATLALPTAAAQAADRCPHRAGERTLARSATAVVTLSAPRTVFVGRQPTHEAQRLVGCSRRSGARRLLDVLERWPTGGDVMRTVRLVGTRVAYHWLRTDRGPGADELTVDDAVHRGRRRTLTRLEQWPVADPANERIASYALASDGTAAWIVKGPDGDDLRLWRPGAALRRVDHGFALAGPLTLAGGTVRWRHRGAARSAPSALPPGSCGGFGGTDQLGVAVERGVPYVSKANGTIVEDRFRVCARAGGGTTDLGCGCEISSYDVAGLYAAVAAGPVVTRFDLTRSPSTTEPWEVEGSALVAIDDAGSMVWADRLPGPPFFRTRIWVRDRDGTRQVAVLDGRVTNLARDGRTVVVKPDGPTITLSP
jgi:hypothetical protein